VKPHRLFSMMLLLQSRPQVSAAELALELGVSVRTVLRDVAWLEEAGAPVYVQRGRYGGISILPGAQLDTSRLSPEEVDRLRMGGLDQNQLTELGLVGTDLTVQRKLRARAKAPVDDLIAVSKMVVVDNRAWFSPDPSGVSPGELIDDLRRGRRLRISYRRSAEPDATWRTVDPYGLLSKAGRWYLVADSAGKPRLFPLERLDAWEVGRGARRLRSGETLESVAKELSLKLEREAVFEVRARLRADRLDLAKRILGRRLARVSSLDAEHVEITVAYDQLQGIRQLLQFGEHLTLTHPPEATRAMREIVDSMASMYRQHS
jgi:predicted DNA-binding transcriptional regulator YafY